MGPPASVCYAVKLYHLEADARNAPGKKDAPGEKDALVERDAACRWGACLGLQLCHDGGGSVLLEDGLELAFRLRRLAVHLE